MNLYDINISDHSFYADFYVWFKWKGNRDPTKIEFVNAIEKWGMTQTTFYDSTKILANGTQRVINGNGFIKDGYEIA